MHAHGNMFEMRERERVTSVSANDSNDLLRPFVNLPALAGNNLTGSRFDRNFTNLFHLAHHTINTQL